MKGLYRFTILLLLLISSYQINAQTHNSPSATLPDSLSGWKKLGEDKTYNEQNLYDYIDGAAELYISFGFTKVFNRIYSAGEGKEIIVDIFYMNTPQDAFGAFSFSVGKIGNDFGVQSQTTSGSIVFWKNNLVVSVVQNPESEEAGKASFALAKIIDESITEKGLLPEVIKYLPNLNLDKESIRYFRHYVWLNTYAYLSEGNILNIDQSTHGVFAKYGGKEKQILLLVKYPTQELAQTAAVKFYKEYYKTEKPKPVVKHKNKYSGAKVVKNFFVAVFGGSNTKAVRELLSLTQETIKDL